jgi:hypothetical protein
MPQERTFCKALLTPNNKIMIIGGTDSVYQSVSRIEMYISNNNIDLTHKPTLSEHTDKHYQ